jgi:hypothetical protein
MMCKITVYKVCDNVLAVVSVCWAGTVLFKHWSENIFLKPDNDVFFMSWSPEKGHMYEFMLYYFFGIDFDIDWSFDWFLILILLANSEQVKN